MPNGTLPTIIIALMIMSSTEPCGKRLMSARIICWSCRICLLFSCFTELIEGKVWQMNTIRLFGAARLSCPRDCVCVCSHVSYTHNMQLQGCHVICKGKRVFCEQPHAEFNYAARTQYRRQIPWLGFPGSPWFTRVTLASKREEERGTKRQRENEN